MTKIAGSGYISQRHESADPDPHQNVMDPQHWFCGGGEIRFICQKFTNRIRIKKQLLSDLMRKNEEIRGKRLGQL
jgi:hypothetical protein